MHIVNSMLRETKSYLHWCGLASGGCTQDTPAPYPGGIGTTSGGLTDAMHKIRLMLRETKSYLHLNHKALMAACTVYLEDQEAGYHDVLHKARCVHCYSRFV